MADPTPAIAPSTPSPRTQTEHKAACSGTRQVDLSDGRVVGMQGRHSIIASLRSRLSTLSTDQWFWEVLGIAFSVADLVAICAILVFFDGKAAPRLPHGITLNAIISILAFLGRASLLMTVAAAIGQSKWLWFRRRHTLVGLQDFADASRGPLGALSFMTGRHGSVIAWLGALTMVFSAGFEPFLQQLIIYPSRDVVSASEHAVLRTTWNDSATEGARSLRLPIFGIRMTAAIEAAIFGGDNNLRWLPSCPRGKCLWPTYFSPAICSKCVNITEQISVGSDPHNETLSHFQKRAAAFWAADVTASEIYDTPLYNQTVIPPRGLPLNVMFLADSILSNSSQSFETTVSFPSSVTWALNSQPQLGEDWTPGTFLGIENPLVDFARISLAWDPEDKGAKVSEAWECVVTLCVNEYSTSIEGTQLHADVLSTTYGSLWKDSSFKLLWSGSVNGTNLYSAGDDSPDAQGWVGLLSEVSLRIAGDKTTVNSYNCSLPTRSGSMPDCHFKAADSGTSFSLDEYQAIDSYGNFSRVVDNVAGAISDLMHQYGTHEIIGETHVPQSFVHIRWPWIILPGCLVLAGIVTLLFAVLETSRSRMPAWKLASLPLLCRGPYSSPTQTVEGSDLAGNEVSMMERNAAQVRVQLQKQEETAIWRLEKHLEDDDDGPLPTDTSKVAKANRRK